MTDVVVMPVSTNDPHRAELADWLNAAGWRAEARKSQDEMRSLGRWLDIPMGQDDDAFSAFVTAVKP